MTDSANHQKICEAIHDYIFNVLNHCIDSNVFSCTTLTELGKYFYQKILSNVPNSSDELINTVLCGIMHKNSAFDVEDDYYKNLCSLLWIKSLPRDVYKNIKQKYDELFLTKYPTMLTLAATKKDEVDNRMSDIDNMETTIKQAIRSARRLTYDLEVEEKKLYGLDLERKELETEKEMYCWLCDFVTDQLKEFCNFEDINTVENALKAKAMQLSKDDPEQLQYILAPYEDYVNIAEDVLQRPYIVAFKVKFSPIWATIYQKYDRESFLSDDLDTVIDRYRAELSTIPSFDKMHNLKMSSAPEYLTLIKNCIQTFSVLDSLDNSINTNISLRNRKDILKRIVQLYKSGDFELFANTVPIQIEGMFADFLNDSTVFSRFTVPQIHPSAVLREKIRIIQQRSINIYPEAIQYFNFHFNNMVRNKIAHGSYKSIYNDNISAEVFACETLLDLNFMIYMLSRQSETEKMYRFIHGYKEHYAKRIKRDNPHFGALFNDLSGNKYVHEYDSIEKYRPIQIAYWILNPCYEKIYEAKEDKSDLIGLRQDILSQEFWEYVVDELKKRQTWGYSFINREMKSVVCGLFDCSITPEVRKLLMEANQLLSLMDNQGMLK